MPKDLDELRERKQELLLESEINRQILVLEASQIKIKAVEWRRNFLKVGAIYKWVAPLAGVGMGFLVARKQVKRTQARAHHNGHRGRLGYLQMLAPLGLGVMRQVLKWRQRPQGRTAPQRNDQ